MVAFSSLGLSFLRYSGLGLAVTLCAAPVAQAAPLASLSGATSWLNTQPLSAETLKGKVVLVDFWTYSCINCLRELPYVEAWADKYKPYGLVVIGVHAPEFAFEKNVDNIKKAVARFHITFPVAVDNDRTIWNGFGNEYWPAAYFVGGDGKVQAHHFGEGDYNNSERMLQAMLRENGAKDVPSDLVHPKGSAEQVEADQSDIGSPETISAMNAPAILFQQAAPFRIHPMTM